jgi:hypothetical protein
MTSLAPIRARAQDRVNTVMASQDRQVLLALVDEMERERDADTSAVSGQ